MKILGLIVARGGSKGVPKKNSKLLNGKPLIDYTFQSAKESKKITTLIISTDDDEIISLAQKSDIMVPFKRPEHLAQDNTPSIDVIKHALENLEKLGYSFDAVCLLQPTSPFRPKGFIDAAIEKFIDTKVDALVSVRQVPLEFNPHWVFVENENGTLEIATGDEKIIPRRQELPKSFYRDGCIYITKSQFIKNSSLYGNSLGYIENTDRKFVNIDTLEDWKIAERIAKKHNTL